MKRVKLSSREHAMGQLRGFAESAEWKDHKSGARVSHVADLTLIRKGDTLITIYERSEYERKEAAIVQEL